ASTTGDSGTVWPPLPHSPLDGWGVHTVRVEGVSDSAGNAAGVFVSTFTTGNAADTERPEVLSITPPNGASSVPTNATLEIEVSEPIDPTSVTESSLTLFSYGTSQY